MPAYGAGTNLYVYPRDGEQELKPRAVTLLAKDAADCILERGLVPLVSLKGQGVVRLVRFRSIAPPLRPLAERWRT